MAELSPKKRFRVELMDFMRRNRRIATSLNISQGAVSKTLKRIRNNDFEGDLRSRKRSGRPLKISPRTDARIKRIVHDDPIVSSVDIVSKLNLTEKISARTVDTIYR